MDLITPIPSPSLVPTVLVLQHNTLCAQRGGQLLGNNNVTLHILSAPPIYPPSSWLVYQTLMRKSLDYHSILYKSRLSFLLCLRCRTAQNTTTTSRNHNHSFFSYQTIPQQWKTGSSANCHVCSHNNVYRRSPYFSILLYTIPYLYIICVVIVNVYTLQSTRY